ncbi:hypothetical protein DIPPA_14146 [Diplonema papillatum]|nr:hypothetical protein DIPPA_14146 [Diplonema papillatum]|eukprot:gene19570-30142_t
MEDGVESADEASLPAAPGSGEEELEPLLRLPKEELAALLLAERRARAHFERAAAALGEETADLRARLDRGSSGLPTTPARQVIGYDAGSGSSYRTPGSGVLVGVQRKTDPIARLHKALVRPPSPQATEHVVDSMMQELAGSMPFLPIAKVSRCCYTIDRPGKTYKMAVHSGSLVIRVGCGYEDVVTFLEKRAKLMTSLSERYRPTPKGHTSLNVSSIR